MFKFIASTVALGFCAAPLLSVNALANENTDAAQALAADEAFVLVKMGVRGELKQYVSSLNFSGKQGDYELKVPKEQGFQLVKVKAGTYQPEAFGLKFASKNKEQAFDHNDLRDKAVVIEPGTVTYIGQWDIAYGERFEFLGRSVTNDVNGYRVSYSVSSVNEFANDNEWITDYPLRFSHISGQNVETTWHHINQPRYN